jgi:hypothetical protein
VLPREPRLSFRSPLCSRWRPGHRFPAVRTQAGSHGLGRCRLARTLALPFISAIVGVISGSPFPLCALGRLGGQPLGLGAQTNGAKASHRGTEDTESIEHQLSVYSVGCLGSVSALAYGQKECRAGTHGTATGTVALPFSERALLGGQSVLEVRAAAAAAADQGVGESFGTATANWLPEGGRKLRACFKNRPVRGPGLQGFRILAISRRPRTLTRRPPTIIKHALREGLDGRRASSTAARRACQLAAGGDGAARGDCAPGPL